MKKVFLSYARTDRDRARKLYEALNALPGIEVWFDEANLIPGVRWKPAIRKAIRESRYFIALLSRQSASAKGYRHSELRLAIEIMEEFPEDYIFVIPTRLENCEPPLEFLTELMYADLFPDWEFGLANLQRTLGVAPTKASSVKTKRDLKPRRQSTFQAAVPDLVSGTRRPVDYHYQVELVDLSIGLRELKSVARGLNGVQNFVYFHVSKLAPSRKAVRNVNGEPHLDIGNLSKQFYSKISPLRMDYVICLTDRFLTFEEDGIVHYNYLGVESRIDVKVAFRSNRNLDRDAAEAEVSTSVALSYLLVSNLTSYFLDLDYHKATRRCPLDFTEVHRDKILGIRKGEFCTHCQRKLLKNTPLRDAMNAMLQWGR